MDHDPTPLPDELLVVAARLQAERPQPTARQLDAVQRRLAQGHRLRKGIALKTRLAMIAMLVTGMFATTTGAGLAVSGLGTSGSAAESQYSNAVKPETDRKTRVLGEEVTNEPTRSDKPLQDVQPTRQVELGADAPAAVAGDELPFTGFAAIPVLVLGLGLLGGGLVLRKRVS